MRSVDAIELALTHRLDARQSRLLLGNSLRNSLDWHRRRTEWLLEQARTLRTTSRHREAAAQLSEALTFAIKPPFALFSDSASLRTELVDILDAHGEAALAFAVSEDGRALRLLLNGYQWRRGLDLDAVRRSLPEGSLLVSYVAVENDLVVFAIDRTGYQVMHAGVGRAELEKRIDAFTARLADGRNWQPAAGALYDTLFGALRRPIDRYSTVVIVPDGPLDRVPFAALFEPSTGRCLIERSALVIAPSASVYVQWSAMPRTRPSRAVVVGDPDAGIAPRLAAAADEARRIATLYGGKPIVGREATASFFQRLAADADVIHLGTHASISDDPMESKILMSQSAVTIRDLLSTRVRRGSIAVLAGCQTGARTGTFDVNSLALAFLAAGSRTSIASLWNVDDAPTRRFSVPLHRLLRAGVPAAEAVRRVQLEMMRSADPRVSNVRAWAAFQVYGGG